MIKTIPDIKEEDKVQKQKSFSGISGFFYNYTDKILIILGVLITNILLIWELENKLPVSDFISFINPKDLLTITAASAVYKIAKSLIVLVALFVIVKIFMIKKIAGKISPITSNTFKWLAGISILSASYSAFRIYTHYNTAIKMIALKQLTITTFVWSILSLLLISGTIIGITNFFKILSKKER